MTSEQKLNKEQAGKRLKKTFPYYKFQGTHREIGQQYGEACKELIHRNLEYAMARLKERVDFTSEILEEKVLSYREYVLKYAPFFDEEIKGVAEGAGITLTESYLLQLRAEIYEDLDASLECTTFAYSEEASCDGVPLIGQNADLPDFYSEVGVILEIVPEDGPSILMLTPAGQVSYIGINNKGVGVFANFLTCDGWRTGFPRYLTSRLALTQQSVNDARELLSSLYRASSRNLLMLDLKNTIVDLETTTTSIAPLYGKNGIIAHANHYLSEEFLAEERLQDIFLENSIVRQKRIEELLHQENGELNLAKVMTIFRDRESYPHCLSRVKSDIKCSDVITFASVIASPSKGEIWVAAGPPHLYEYERYCFS